MPPAAGNNTGPATASMPPSTLAVAPEDGVMTFPTTLTSPTLPVTSHPTIIQLGPNLVAVSAPTVPMTTAMPVQLSAPAAMSPLMSPPLMSLTSATLPISSPALMPQLPLSQMFFTTPPPPTLGISTAMEVIWHGEFDKLFSQYFPHQWTLQPAEKPPSDWRVFKDSAKVRFSCQDCGHGWTSMKGRVVFWFHLDLSTMCGNVLFRLFGQVCQRCNTGRYENAMWYPEEVLKVVGNVYNRVGQMYYGFYRPPLRVDRRQGKPRDQHNAQHCEACKEGLCREEWTFS